MTVEELMKSIDGFALDRDWIRYHTPKNLALSVGIEAAELVEHFQWLTDEESRAVVQDPEEQAKIAGEVADVLIYLLRFCSVAGIDPIASASAKLEENRSRIWNR